MRRFVRSLALTASCFAAATIAGSCSTDRLATSPLSRVGTAANIATTIRISEIHYDNSGTDANEAIEVSFPVGTSLAGWSLVLYNGAAGNGTDYDTRSLSALTPVPCPGGERFVVTQTYGVNGIQNGSPDGIALVGPGGLVEFLSYEGTFTGASGPANGIGSTDIDVSQAGSEAFGLTLQRSGDGTWSGPKAHSFHQAPYSSGTPCNFDDRVAAVDHVTIAPPSATIDEGASQQFTATAFDASNNPIPSATFTWVSTAPAVVSVSATGLASGLNAGDAEIQVTSGGKTASATLHVDDVPDPVDGPVNIVEIHYDNASTDVGEAIEIEGLAGQSLAGWSLVLYNQTGGAVYGTIALSGVIPDQCAGGKGTLAFSAPGLQNGPADGVALVKPGVGVVEFLSYEGTLTAAGGAAAGTTSVSIGVDEDGDEPAGMSLQKDAIGWYGPNPASFGTCNAALDPFVSIGGRSTLPVGFEDQFFATLNDGRGATSPSTFTWTSETPGIATVDADGVAHAHAAGTAILRATAATGVTGTTTFTAIVATAGPAVYANHIEFGAPTDADASDEVIITRTEFTSSFSTTRGIPNWVSFNLEQTHFGAQDRCDCFTFDPLVGGAWPAYTTADYTGAGAFAGYGIDRGHLARSFDRTSGLLDNARTFYFSNIIPQASDNNQGPWAAMEIAMGDLARFQNKELFVIAGASGSKGTVKNEGLITIPAHTWKVVVVLPRDQGLSSVDSWDDVEVIAVIMPNDPGIRGVPWETYKTTVDAVEALSGYDLLARLNDDIEGVVESGFQAPLALVAQLVAAGTLNKGNGNALSSTLEDAAKSLFKGNTTAARNQIGAFVNQVDAFEQTGKLSAADAAALRGAVNAILTTL